MKQFQSTCQRGVNVEVSYTPDFAKESRMLTTRPSGSVIFVGRTGILSVVGSGDRITRIRLVSGDITAEEQGRPSTEAIADPKNAARSKNTSTHARDGWKTWL